MANITLSQSLLDTDLRSLTTPATILSTWSTAINEINGIATGGLPFDSERVLLDSMYNGKVYSRKNPSYSSELGTGIVLGSISQTFDLDGNLIRGAAKITGVSFDTGDGKGALKGTYSESYSASTGIYSRTQKYTEFSFKGNDKSSWSLKGTYSETYSGTYSENDSLSKKTEIDKRTLKSTITSISSSDDNGNSITYSGNIKFNSSTDEWTGYLTTQTVTNGQSKFTSTGLKLSYYDVFTQYGGNIGAFKDMLPSLQAGNDLITLSSSDPIAGTVFGYGGNDKVIGSSESDSILGEDGNDTLIGGRGGDLIDGGNGNDSMNGGNGNDSMNGGDGNDTLIGGRGGDLIDGGNGNDSMNGGDGSDRIEGGAGSNYISGGAGGDTLIASGLNDSLVGGNGADVFNFHLHKNKDGIYEASFANVIDFKIGEDKIYARSEEVYLSTVYDPIACPAVYPDMCPFPEQNFIIGYGETQSSYSGVYFIFNLDNSSLYYDPDADGNDTGLLVATLIGVKFTGQGVERDRLFDESIIRQLVAYEY